MDKERVSQSSNSLGQSSTNSSNNLEQDLTNAQLEMQRKLIKGTQDVVEKAQKTLEKLPEGFQAGLDQVAKMFWIQFWLGIFLLFSSIVLYLLGFDVLTYVFGATGGIILINTFITSSPNKLQKNRVDLAQWGISYFNWFNTLLATQTVISASLQSGTVTWKMFKDSHKFLLEITERTLWDMEELCEFSDRTKTKPEKEKSEPKPE